MSAVPVDEPPGTLKRPDFWQKLARALDAFFAVRTKRAVPEAALRRSTHEVARCRRLMLKGATTTSAAATVPAAALRAAHTPPRHKRS